MSDRAAGVLSFLPVPFVLWLFTRAPLGVLPSLLLGIGLVATHRLYARPFALERAARRCLWCGGASGSGPELAVVEPLGATRWRACGPVHRDRLLNVFGFAASHATFLRLGVLGTLAVFLLVGLAIGASWLPAARYPADVAFFRIGIALTVLPLGFLAARVGPRALEPARVPFPLHIQALIGTAPVLWLFRIVGIVCLGLGAWFVAGRWGGALL